MKKSHKWIWLFVLQYDNRNVILYIFFFWILKNYSILPSPTSSSSFSFGPLILCFEFFQMKMKMKWKKQKVICIHLNIIWSIWFDLIALHRCIAGENNDFCCLTFFKVSLHVFCKKIYSFVCENDMSFYRWLCPGWAMIQCVTWNAVFQDTFL